MTISFGFSVIVSKEEADPIMRLRGRGTSESKKRVHEEVEEGERRETKSCALSAENKLGKKKNK
jgi:hypothetical protein